MNGAVVRRRPSSRIGKTIGAAGGNCPAVQWAAVRAGYRMGNAVLVGPGNTVANLDGQGGRGKGKSGNANGVSAGRRRGSGRVLGGGWGGGGSCAWGGCIVVSGKSYADANNNNEGNDGKQGFLVHAGEGLGRRTAY